MNSISIFNDVLGPVMRGPSSSHTAGSFRIARLVRDLLGGPPARARVAFDPSGSYAQVYREQGVDRGFATGLLGWALTDPRFSHALDLAPLEGLDLGFEVRPLTRADHPNTVEVEADSLRVTARSIGGGSVEIVSVDGWPVLVTGQTYDVLIECDGSGAGAADDLITRCGEPAAPIDRCDRGGRVLLHARRRAPLPDETRAALLRLPATRVRESAPVAFVKRGEGLFASAAEMIAAAEQRQISLGRLALAHEAAVVGISEADAIAEMRRRLDVMTAAVAEGLTATSAGGMQLLHPSAGSVFEAEAAGRVAMGGPHTRAAARALAAMHVNSRMGIVCAAPTGGSAGVLPGVITTLFEKSGSPVGQGFSLADPVLALFAAGAIGVVVAERATFAAEVAGCQLEIGAAGAMAAAAVVEAAGGTARQAADAAAIAFQNTMGSVCDLVQGIVEIPCHTRNAVAASSAFVCADLALGGYVNPIPLDETVDAVFAVGKMLPAELRCTARGGLAVTPSAIALRRRS